MALKKLYTLCLIVFCSTLTIGQLAKGDAFYEKSEFVSAIPCYKKALKSKNSGDRQLANIKLGSIYQKLNDYAKAESSYRQAIETTDGLVIEKDVYFKYAQVLKSNTKYEEAAKYYNLYLQQSPSDEYAKKALKFCAEINYYLAKPVEYSIKNIESINTEKAEFSPFVANNKLMFVAENESFDFVNYEVNSSDGQPYIQMFVSEIEGEKVKKSKTLSKNLASEYHDGPACLTTDGHTLYFTRVMSVEKKGFVNRSKIYSATGSNRSWKNVKVLSFCSDDYSVAHPCISADNKTIYFTSDMPGGFGGKDIWMCVKTDSVNWGPPVNLGADINTSGDEMFPSLRKDGKLFFSSNGLPGFGGLDIYSANKIDNKWILGRNEGIQLNSSTDDFGITFLTDTTGYFSSNRTGGKGKDDIYFYKFKDRTLQLGGTVLLSKNIKDIAPEKKVILYDDKGLKVDSTFTNNKGQFIFKNLSSEKKYIAVVDEPDPQLMGKKKYYLAQKDTVITGVTTRLPDGKFGFKNVQGDVVPMGDSEGQDISFAGKLLTGESNNQSAMKKVKVKLVNQAGEVLGETVTDENGNFTFKNIPADQNYIVAIADEELHLPEGTRITMTNKAGKEVKSSVKTKENFAFNILASEKNIIHDLNGEEDINFAGKLLTGDNANQAMKKVKVKLVNSAGEVLGETTTDENGNFSFKNIPADQNYIVAIDDEELRLPEGTRITMTNKAGKEIKSSVKTKENFAFNILSSEKSAIKDMNAEEDISFAGTLMSGDKASHAMKNVKVKILNQAGEVIGETMTNEFGAFAFRNIPGDQNFIVSIDEGDVQLPQGTRITITNKSGKEVKSIVKDKDENFDFKILSSDKNVIEDMDAGDASMVMGIYGFVYDQDKKPISNAHITVKDEDGTNARKIMTNPYGKFSFKNLSAEKNYIFEFDPNDKSLFGVKSIQIADSKGKIYRIIELESGNFTFKMLEADKNAMGEFSVDDPWLKLTEVKKREMRAKAERDLAAKKAADLAAQRERELAEKTAKELALVEKNNKEEAAKEMKRIKEEAARESKRIKDEELAAKRERDRQAEQERIQAEKDEEAAADMEISITIVENIYYGYGKFDVTEEAKVVLDKAYDVLNGNSKLDLEINSHTDSQSSYGFNLNLSRKRAQAAVDYLVAKGISPSRLKSNGYGELKLLNKCFNNVKCTDAEHAVNRRTEFKIIKSKKRLKK